MNERIELPLNKEDIDLIIDALEKCPKGSKQQHLAIRFAGVKHLIFGVPDTLKCAMKPLNFKHTNRKWK